MALNQIFQDNLDLILRPKKQELITNLDNLRNSITQLNKIIKIIFDTISPQVGVIFSVSILVWKKHSKTLYQLK